MHQAIEKFRALGDEAPTDGNFAMRLYLVNRTGSLFNAIGEASGNREFADQIAAANRRLHYLRLAETHVFTDYALELGRLIKGIQNDVANNVGRRILAYHRRRIEQTGPILKIALEMTTSTHYNDLEQAGKRVKKRIP